MILKILTAGDRESISGTYKVCLGNRIMWNGWSFEGVRYSGIYIAKAKRLELNDKGLNT